MELLTVPKRSPLDAYWEKVKVGLKWMFNIHNMNDGYVKEVPNTVLSI